MKVSELIKLLNDNSQVLGYDAEVLIQSYGCCPHGHEIEKVEEGGNYGSWTNTDDEKGSIIIRG